MALSEEQMQALQAEHRRVKRVVVGSLEIVLRAPRRHEYKQFRAKALDPSRQSDAQEDLVRLIVVHPSREAFDTLLEDWPGLTDAPAMSKAIQSLTGQAADDEGNGYGTSASGNAGAPNRLPTG